MFSNLANRLNKNIQEVKAVVVWQEALRNTLNAPEQTPAEIPIDAAAITALKGNAPNKLAWQIFDHYAAVTYIYASFEKAICELVEEYLGILPKVCKTYDDLHEKVRVQHRVGVGQVLLKWSSDNPFYQALAEQSIVSGLADGLRGNPYSLLLEAFLLSPENFRSNAIRKLFVTLGFDDAFAFVSKSERIKEFLISQVGETETADSFLDEFVRIRNEAAHGAGSHLVGVKEITNYVDFVILVVEELANILRTRALTLGLESGFAKNIGEVSHVYSQNVVGVVSANAGVLSVGENVYGGKRTIYPISVLSIQTGETSHSSLNLTPGLEFGIKLDKKLVNGSKIIRLG